MPGNNVNALWQRQVQGLTSGLAFVKARNRFKNMENFVDHNKQDQSHRWSLPTSLHGSLIRPKKGEHTVRVFVGGREYGHMKVAQHQHLKSINKIYLNDNYYQEKFDNLTEKLNRYSDIFMEFDVDNSGDIDFYELKMMMQKLGQPKTHLELKKMIATVDRSGSGTLTYREFVDMMLGPRSAIFQHILLFEDISREKLGKRAGPPPRRSLKDLP